MKKILLILLFLLIPNLLFASERVLSKSDACHVKDGEYIFGSTLSGYDLLEVRWNGSDAKVYGFLKQGNILYYGLTVVSSGRLGVDLYIFQYSCKYKTSEKIAHILYMIDGDIQYNEVFISSLGNKRYFRIWGGVKDGGGGDWGIIDVISKKYYEVVDYPDFEKMSIKCEGPGGCFSKFSVEKGIVYAYFSENNQSEKLEKYRIDFIRKKLYKN